MKTKTGFSFSLLYIVSQNTIHLTFDHNLAKCLVLAFINHVDAI